METCRKHLASFGLRGCCLSISVHRSLGPGLATRFVTLLFPAAYLRCSLRSPPIWTAGRIWLHPALASVPWASKMPRDVWIWLTSRPCGYSMLQPSYCCKCPRLTTSLTLLALATATWQCWVFLSVLAGKWHFLSMFLFSIYLSLSICLSVCPSVRPYIDLSIYPFIHLCIYIHCIYLASLHLSTWLLPSTYALVHPSINPSIHPSIHLFIYINLSIYPSIRLFIYSSIYHLLLPTSYLCIDSSIDPSIHAFSACQVGVNILAQYVLRYRPSASEVMRERSWRCVGGLIGVCKSGLYGSLCSLRHMYHRDSGR